MKEIHTKINNYNWTIKIDCEKMDNDYLGLTRNSDYTIMINSDCSDQARSHALIHELTHAFMYSNGMMCRDTYSNEDVCEFIACHISSIMKTYKEVMDKYVQTKK